MSLNTPLAKIGLEGAFALDGLLQPFKIFNSGDINPSQLCRYWSKHLNIKQAELALPQMFRQMKQRHFRGIAYAVEHGFARKKAADCDPVDTANKLRGLPALQAMSMALVVQLGVGFDELAANPTAPPSRGGRRAPFHHFPERLV